MWEYTAYSLRPDGHGVLNNDSNLDLNGPAVLRAAETWGRPDWAFIASNGEQGLEPEAGPSAVFPWARQFIMRSGWEREAHWGVFDVGPWGTGHQHNDKLHLSISAGGRDLLVDAGRLYYKHDPWRRFVMSSAAHNTVLVDGRGQRDDVPQVDAPLDEAAYHIGAPVDYARGAFAAGYEGVAGTAVHTRAVAYVRGRFWVVVDRVETDRPRQVQALWHFHPHCAVEQRGAAVHTANAGKHNVCVVPTGDPVWRVDRVAGQEEPHIQGWYSREYNVKEAATCAVYTADVPGTTSWAWVIAPGPGAVTEPSAEWLGMAEGEARVRVRHRDETLTVHVPLDAGQVRVN